MRPPLVRIILLWLIAIAAIFARWMIDRDPAAGTLGFNWPHSAYAEFRAAAIAVCLIIGIALATSGVLLQSLLRNPLASPFILGISSGAGLGVMIAMYVQHTSGVDLFFGLGDTLPAIIGALVTLLVVYMLGQRRGLIDPVTIILVGVIIATICGAGMMLLQSLIPAGLRGDFLRWMMGRISDAPQWREVSIAAGVTLIATIIALRLHRAMDAAVLSDDEAQSVGIAIGRLRLWLYLLAGLLAAVSVAVAGPIGFVGLIAPHAARLIIGPHHKPLLIGSAACGIALIALADTARHSVTTSIGSVPIGVVTALLGGPLFLWLLLSQRRGW